METSNDISSPKSNGKVNPLSPLAAALSITALTAGLLLSFGSFSAASANYSILCNGCDLGSPFPTERTLSEIKNYVKVSAPVPAQSGDTVTVCNGTACVQYTLDDSGNYIGAPPIKQTTSPPGGGGGGGGGGSGGVGGVNPGGGCYGNCGGGVVTIKPIFPIRPQ